MAGLRRRGERAEVAMLLWIVITTGIYRVFLRQLNATQEAKWPRASSGAKRNEAGARQREPRALKRLGRFARLAGWQFKALMALYAYEFCRLTLIQLISSEALRDFHFLDCLVVGRFRLVGHLSSISGRILLAFIAVFACYHWIFFVLPPDIEFYALEFLFEDQAAVKANERAQPARASGDSQQAPRLCDRRPLRANRGWPKRPRALGPLERPSRIYYFKCPFEARDDANDADYNDDDDDDDFDERDDGDRRASEIVEEDEEEEEEEEEEGGRWILRPNRTGDSWRALRQFTLAMCLLSGALLLAWLLWTAHVLSGSLLTCTGFELAYPTCSSWTTTTAQRRQRRPQNAPANATWALAAAAAPYFENIYAAPRPGQLAHQLNVDALPAIIPLVPGDLVPLSWFSVYHASADLVANALWYYEFMTVILGEIFFIFLFTLDIFLNTRAISRRLRRAIRQLECLHKSGHIGHHHHQQRAENERPAPAVATMRRRQHYGPLSRISNKQSPEAIPERFMSLGQLGEAPRALNPANVALREEIRQLQAILVDHFNMVRGYNRFVSLHVILIIALWCAVSAVISGWMVTTKSRALEFEFLVTETGGTIFAVLFFASAAIARSLNYRLYRLLTSAMALDDHRSGTKLRWLAILRYYRPKPMFCFTLFETTEISLMFCLQFVWWVVSVFVVLANFFYGHR